MEQTFTATLLSAVRYSGLHEGSPTYRLITSEGGFDTKPGAQLNHEVTNHADVGAADSWIGKRVEFTASMGGTVRGWKLADE